MLWEEEQAAKQQLEAETRQAKKAQRRESRKMSLAKLSSALSAVPDRIDQGIRAFVGESNETLIHLYKGLLLVLAVLAIGLASWILLW